MNLSNAIESNNTRYFLLITILTLLLAIAGSFGRDFNTRGEGREAVVIQNMYYSGDWILPPGYGGAVPSKPPAMHWMASLASYIIGDVNEFSARLPSVLSMVFFTLIYFKFLEKRHNSQFAFLTTLILLTSFEWFRAGTSCRVDMVLSSAFAGGLLSLFIWSENKLVSFPIVSILLFTIATLCKGPVAIVLPAGLFAFFLWLSGSTFKRIFISLLIVFIPVFLGASVWYLAAYYSDPDRFLEKVYFENIARFLGTSSEEPHKHNVFYLLGMIPLGTIPWSLLFIPLSFIKKVRSSLFEKLRNWRALSPFTIFSLIIVFGCVGFFSIPSSKRGVYLLPMYPFLAHLFAKIIVYFKEECEFLFRRFAQCLFYILWTLIIAAIIFSIFIVRYNIYDLSLLIFIVFGFLYFRSAAKAIYNQWSFNYGIYSVIIISLISWCFIRPVANLTSAKMTAQVISKDIVSDKEIISYKNSFYGLSFYLKRQLRMSTNEFPNDSIVVMYEDQLENFSKELGSNQRYETIFTSPNPVDDLRKHLFFVKIASNNR